MIMAAEVLPEDEGPLFAVVEGWQQKPEARGLINALLKRNKRRNFGRLLLSHGSLGAIPSKTRGSGSETKSVGG